MGQASVLGLPGGFRREDDRVRAYQKPLHKEPWADQPIRYHACWAVAQHPREGRRGPECKSCAEEVDDHSCRNERNTIRRINPSNQVTAQSRPQTTLPTSLTIMAPPNMSLHSTRLPTPLNSHLTLTTPNKTPIMPPIHPMPQHILTPQTNHMDLTPHRILPPMLLQLLPARKPYTAHQTLLSVEIRFNVECVRARGRHAVGH